MIAVIFESQPPAGRLNDYLGAGAKLQALLADIDGLISIAAAKKPLLMRSCGYRGLPDSGRQHGMRIIGGHT